MRTVELHELGSSRHSLSAGQGRLLARSELVSATQVGPETWELSAKRKVGAVRIGDVVLRIAPKLDIRRLLFLAGYAVDPKAKGWRDDEIELDADVELVPAAANALWRLTERALRRGIYRDYQEVDETSQVLRGRLREADQLRIHYGNVVPLEQRYDDFSTDVPENRILLAAVTRMLTVPRLDPVSQRHLRALRRSLANTAMLVRGRHLPGWRPSRLNAHYHAALQLAEILWQGMSPEHVAGAVSTTGFLFDLPTIFEDFVTVALSESLPRHAAGVPYRQFQCSLDEAAAVRMRPDLVWHADGGVAAVLDAKYKQEERSGYPNEDIYQMLAYCVALGPRRGHLVYAKGNSQPVRHVVRRGEYEVVCHALDLTQQPAELLRWVDDLARELTER